MVDFKVPLIIRGRIIDDYDAVFEDRTGGYRFATAPVENYLDSLRTDAESLQDLYEISFDEILDYLGELTARLDLDSNAHWRRAFEVSCRTSNVSTSVLEDIYRHSPARISREKIREVADLRIGIPYLEGWVPAKLDDGRTMQVRAMGARNVQIVAGNVPVVPLMTLLRTAITRSDAIVKVPSNDPLTMGAIAQTMIEMAPEHPITRHMSVAYWKGGNDRIEDYLYQPRNIEKLIAWGGLSSIKHVAKYIQPGIELITLDPKSSATLLGSDAFADDAIMAEVAARVAVDIGGIDQEACSNARMIFAETGTDARGIELAQRFGRMLYHAIQILPSTLSGGRRNFDPDLKAELLALLQQRVFYDVVTEPREIEQRGAVIVSLHGEQVDFPSLLSGRVANLVPVDNIEDALQSFSAATQTVGIFPDDLRRRLRDRAALLGGQRFVAVGGAVGGTFAAPQDGIEPERRMCRWVVDDDGAPMVAAIRERLRLAEREPEMAG